MNKPVAALIYDFDNTLCTKDMQEYGFIPSIGMSASAFWKQVNDLTDQQQMDNILAYMFLMVQKGREEKIPITREIFQKLGEGIEYFEGAPPGSSGLTNMGNRLVCRWSTILSPPASRRLSKAPPSPPASIISTPANLCTATMGQSSGQSSRSTIRQRRSFCSASTRGSSPSTARARSASTASHRRRRGGFRLKI